MFRTTEGLDRLIQSFSFGDDGEFVKYSIMSREAISKYMEVEILAILTDVIPLCLRYMEKSQTDGIAV